MKLFAAAILLSALPLAAADPLHTLRTSTDRATLEAAAISIIESRSASAISELAGLLGDPHFLARLDDLRDPQSETYHLARVLSAAEQAPSAATESLCLALAADPDFTAIPARLNYLLPPLAAVRPMSEAAAAVFRSTNAEGFFSVNAPLLAANGSPRALDLFTTMMTDGTVDPDTRIDAAHRSIVPHRDKPAMLRALQRILAAGLEDAVRIGILESVFDYQPRRWYGPIASPPEPPSWSSLSPASRRLIKDLAKRNAGLATLPPELRTKMRNIARRLN